MVVRTVLTLIRIVRIRMMAVKEFHYVEPAAVHVEMDVESSMVFLEMISPSSSK